MTVKPGGMWLRRMACPIWTQEIFNSHLQNFDSIPRDAGDIESKYSTSIDEAATPNLAPMLQHLD